VGENRIAWGRTQDSPRGIRDPAQIAARIRVFFAGEQPLRLVGEARGDGREGAVGDDASLEE
jgi:hypothetical protein